jgi:hypothetical protein
MSDKDKGFSFRQLFFRDENPVAGKNISTEKPSPVASKPGDDYFTNVSPASGVQDQSLIDDFVQRLQNLINQNNQPGFDFLEFTESLFEEKQTPGPDTYKTVFRIAQKIDKSLTPSRLLESSAFYKDLVQRTAEGEISKGNSKKAGLQSDKDNEKNNLDNGLRDARARIQQLTQQIQELHNQEAALSSQLQAIDQKYNGKMTEIDTKVNAIRSAKEQVLSSIVDIESGIKSNLS